MYLILYLNTMSLDSHTTPHITLLSRYWKKWVEILPAPSCCAKNARNCVVSSLKMVQTLKILGNEVERLRTVIRHLERNYHSKDESMKVLNDKMDLLETHTQCIICFKPYSRSVLFLPCKHYQCCSACSNQLTSCPSCRSPILEAIRVYH